jgi:hypothetical protein
MKTTGPATPKKAAWLIIGILIAFVATQNGLDYYQNYQFTQKVNQKIGPDPNPRMMPGVERGRYVARLCVEVKRAKGAGVSRVDILKGVQDSIGREPVGKEDRDDAQNRMFGGAYLRDKVLYDAIKATAIAECLG